MGIVDEDIARVRDVTDIVGVISNYTQLRRVGRRFTGLCPFHTEKSPSFSVNSEQGLYYCFGCGAKGDAITFLREQEQLDFVGAVEFLANKASITLRYTDKSEGADRARKTKLHDAIGVAVEWYHQRLLSGTDAAPARSYLRQRGFDGDAVRHYKIGWAPDNWDELSKHLKLPADDLKDSGLGFVNSRGRQQDAFRARVLFPIFDAQGRAMGFGGRILPGADGPKYKNSIDSVVYSKSRVLYGLNWAKTEIVAQDEVIVCEGYTDVIGFARAGQGRAVATCGTALTEDHVKLLRRFARRVVLAFDADAAGQNAAARFYEWEKAHDLDVVVADLPDGVDPGELAQSDPERLAEAVKNAQSFLGFRVQRALAAGDMRTAEGRAKTAERALELVQEHPDPLVRDQYVMTIASHCRVNPDLLRQQLGSNPQQRSNRQSAAMPRANTKSRQSVDREVLKLLIHGQGEIRELVPIELFNEAMSIAAYEAIAQTNSVAEAVEQTDEETADLLIQLSVEDPSPDVAIIAALMWKAFLQRQLEDLAYQRSTMDAGADMTVFAEMVANESWYRRQLGEFEDLDNRARTGSAVQALLGWINQSSPDGSTTQEQQEVT